MRKYFSQESLWEIIVEHDFDSRLKNILVKKGNTVRTAIENAFFGRGQIILKMETIKENAGGNLQDKNFTYCIGTEKRCDSGIAAY